MCLKKVEDDNLFINTGKEFQNKEALVIKDFLKEAIHMFLGRDLVFKTINLYIPRYSNFNQD